MKAYAYDAETGTRISFESEQGCCGSCIDDEEFYPQYSDAACCCIHQIEAEERKLVE